MRVIRNTYPRLAGVPHAEPGDIVEWFAGPRCMSLVRKSDGATVFSRDKWPKEREDNRPLIGVVATIKARGWVLEIAAKAAERGE
ncbi:MAG: hypothetical protein WC277_07145 [Bacilli bacterium]